MSKIDKITLSNFKFFSKKETIELNGKHLLLYGENGSGKSSLYWGLYTLLEASMKSPTDVRKYFEPLQTSDESLINIYAPQMSDLRTRQEHSDSYIILETNNGGVAYELSLLSNNVCGNTDAQEARKATDFINYQSIFMFQEFRNSENPDLYEVFAYSILPYVNFGSFDIKGRALSNAGEMWRTYIEGPGTIRNKKGEVIQVRKDSAAYNQFSRFEAHFNNEMRNLIDFINNNSQDVIKKLGYDIRFHLNYSDSSHKRKEKEYIPHPFKVELVITEYNGKPVNIEKPHTFLNEAKMSALAIAIRLTVLDHRFINDENILKVLVLDDLMISLDMSNRDRLMDLLLTDYKDKYQFLFFTHDKNLYTFVDRKIIQHKQDIQWLRKEMYVGEDHVQNIEYPVILDGECDSYMKARKYYEARDYTAAALYIRKSIEEFVTDYLPEEYCKNADGKFVDLNTLWKRFLKYTNSIPTATIEKFDQSRLLILNPSVHYQKISYPIYKRELLKALDLVSELKKVSIQVKILLVDKGCKLVFEHPTADYSFELEMKQDMIRGKNEDPMCHIITWQYEGVEYYDFQTGQKGDMPPVVETRLSRIVANLSKIDVLHITKEMFYENTYIGKGTLKDAIA